MVCVMDRCMRVYNKWINLIFSSDEGFPEKPYPY